MFIKYDNISQKLNIVTMLFCLSIDQYIFNFISKELTATLNKTAN